MKKSSRSAHVPRPARRIVSLGSCLLLAACASPAPTPAPTPVASRDVAAPALADSRALAADLNARLDALRRQPEPASDDVIAALERTLREQREKRARVAGTTAPTTSAASPIAAPAPVAAAPAPAVVAKAAPAKKLSKAARARAAAASAAAARAAAAQPTVVAAAPERPIDTAMSAAALAHSPMAHTAESRQPVDDLYARARALEIQSQTSQAIALYREASQRGHAPSSQRLMELYADGAPGVARDYRVAVFFKERAVQQGVSFEPVWRH